MTDSTVSTVVADAKAAVAEAAPVVAKAEAEVSFIKANWAKLSIGFVAVAVIAFLLRGCL